MRKAEERFFTTHDSVELFYRPWPATHSDTKKAILIFHRGHEHSGRLQHIADELQLPGYDLFAWDARGHGRSPGARGDSPGFAASVRDIDFLCVTFQRCTAYWRRTYPSSARASVQCWLQHGRTITRRRYDAWYSPRPLSACANS